MASAAAVACRTGHQAAATVITAAAGIASTSHPDGDVWTTASHRQAATSAAKLITAASNANSRSSRRLILLRAHPSARSVLSSRRRPRSSAVAPLATMSQPAGRMRKDSATRRGAGRVDTGAACALRSATVRLVVTTGGGPRHIVCRWPATEMPDSGGAYSLAHVAPSERPAVGRTPTRGSSTWIRARAPAPDITTSATGRGTAPCPGLPAERMGMPAGRRLTGAVSPLGVVT